MLRKKWFHVLWVLVFLAASAAPVTASSNDEVRPFCASGELQSAEVVLDNVTISITSPFLPGVFGAASPGDLIQGATAVSYNPYRELSILAVPFGFGAPSEVVPVAQAGGEDAYRSSLHAYRVEQGGAPEVGPAAWLFGKQVTSEVSHLKLHLNSDELKPTVVVEWVVEAGSRLWILRAAQEEGVPPPEPSPVSFLTSLQCLVLLSDSLDVPTTVGTTGGSSPEVVTDDSGVQAATLLPAPPWWDGEVCDATDYFEGTGVPAVPLGSSYRGLVTCGPRPGPEGDWWVAFFSGDPVGAMEWQCVELSMRYLYVAYNIDPYWANGSQVVWNYQDADPSYPIIVAYGNGTVGHAPVAGDVLSFGTTDTAGHTAVVQGSSVDANGNGLLSVIEQNNSPGGVRSLTVTGWTVAPLSGMCTTGWLHPLSGLINGDFEVPDAGDSFTTYYRGESFGNWTATGDSVDLKGQYYWQAASKRQTVDLNGNEHGGIYQDIPTIPFMTYRLSFCMAGNVQGLPVVKTMRVYWGSQDLGMLTFDTTGRSEWNMGWTCHTYTVIAGKSPTRLKFVSVTVGTPCGPVLDNVRLTIP